MPARWELFLDLKRIIAGRGLWVLVRSAQIRAIP